MMISYQLFFLLQLNESYVYDSARAEGNGTLVFLYY